MCSISNSEFSELHTYMSIQHDHIQHATQLNMFKN